MDATHSPHDSTDTDLSASPQPDEVVEAFNCILADRIKARNAAIYGFDPEWQTHDRLEAYRNALPSFDPALGCAAVLPSGSPGLATFIAFASLPSGHAPSDIDLAMAASNQGPAFLAASESFNESFALFSDLASAEAAASRMRLAMDALEGPAQASARAASRPRRGPREQSGS